MAPLRPFYLRMFEMTFQRLLALSAMFSLVVAMLLINPQATFAQQAEPAASQAPPSEYYYPPVTEEKQPSIAQQKAIARGRNRLARLEIQRRHGLVPGRPDATVLPWMSATSLTWTRPRAGMFVYNSGYYRPYYYYSYGYPYTVRR